MSVTLDIEIMDIVTGTVTAMASQTGAAVIIVATTAQVEIVQAWDAQIMVDQALTVQAAQTEAVLTVVDQIVEATTGRSGSFQANQSEISAATYLVAALETVDWRCSWTANPRTDRSLHITIHSSREKFTRARQIVDPR